MKGANLFPIFYCCSECDWLKHFFFFAVDDGVEWAVGVDGDGYWGRVWWCCVGCVGRYGA